MALFLFRLEENVSFVSLYALVWPCNLVCARTLLAIIALRNNMMESRDGCYGNQGEYVPK